MISGLEVRAEDSTVTLSVTSRLTKILGTVSTGFVDGSLTNAELKSGNRIWVFPLTISYDPSKIVNHTIVSEVLEVSELIAGVKQCNILAPQFTISDGLLSWIFTKGTGFRMAMTGFYGVY